MRGRFKHPDFLDKVKEVWDKPCYATSACDRIQAKMKRFKQYFKGWGFNLQGENRKNKKQIQQDLLSLEQQEETCLLSLRQCQKKVDIQSQLLSMLEEEELYWFRRSHEKWLHEGGNNTEFFHRVANGKKRKNNILSLKDGEEIVEGDSNLLAHATEFYKNLFGLEQNHAFSLDPDLWDSDELLADSDNACLIRPFSEEEIKNALFQMEKNKAAGPDSMPIDFFQHCWEIVKTDITQLFDEFHRGTLDVSRLNYGIITLIPKIAEAEKIQQYRPICLLNCIYKWITKTLALRLESVSDKLILPVQTAFMKGRNIVSGILALHEVLHETKRRNQCGVVLKLDFEKAYDKVCWNFLFKNLEIRGFCDVWCNWIKQVVTGGTVCVKINNSCGPYFTSHKGVR